MAPIDGISCLGQECQSKALLYFTLQTCQWKTMAEYSLILKWFSYLVIFVAYLEYVPRGGVRMVRFSKKDG